jgi:transposase-like protein
MSKLSEQSKPGGKRRPGGRYDKEFIESIVNAVSEGLSPKIASERYGVPKGTLSDWMQNYGSIAYQQRRKLPIPTSLKRTVLRAVEQGMTIQEAKTVYQIKSGSAIRRWKKELKEENAELVGAMEEKLPDNKAVTSNTPADILALQRALADAQLKIAALNTLIDVAEEQLKINIRKKPGAKQ